MAIRLRIMAVQMPVAPMPVSIGHLLMAMVPYHASMSVAVSHFVRWTVRHTVDRSIRDSVHLSICHAVGSTVDTCVGWHIGGHCRGHQSCHQHCDSYEHDSAHFLLALSLAERGAVTVTDSTVTGIQVDKCSEYPRSPGNVRSAAPGGGQRIVATPVISGTDSHPVGLPLPTDSRPQKRWPADGSEKANQQLAMG